MATKRGVTRKQVEEIALGYPGVAPYPDGSSERLDLRLGKKMLIFDSREACALCLRPVYEDEQRFLMETSPEVFFLTDHYRGWKCILIRQAKVDREQLAELIDTAWRRIAVKGVIKEYDAARAGAAGASRGGRKAAAKK